MHVQFLPRLPKSLKRSFIHIYRVRKTFQKNDISPSIMRTPVHYT